MCNRGQIVRNPAHLIRSLVGGSVLVDPPVDTHFEDVNQDDSVTILRLNGLKLNGVFMKKLTLMAALMIVALPVLAIAQEDTETAKEAPLLERIQKAAELIKTSREAREAGIPEEEVKEVLEGARERGLSPGETEEILAESTTAVHESGSVDNFGAFVQAKLDEGLRGKELAAAIHEEHRLNGKGKGKGHAKHKMKNEEHKGQRQDQDGRHHEGDNDDRDDEDHDMEQSDDENKDRDKREGHGKGGKKEKGK